jgi:hypothetical protein
MAEFQEQFKHLCRRTVDIHVAGYRPIFQSGPAHIPLGPDVRFVIVALVIFLAVSGQGKA